VSNHTHGNYARATYVTTLLVQNANRAKSVTKRTNNSIEVTNSTETLNSRSVFRRSSS